MSGNSDLAIVPYNEQSTLLQSPSIKSRLLDIGLTAGLTFHQVFQMSADYSDMYGYCSSFPTIHIFNATALFRIPRIIKAIVEENYFVLFSTILAWGLVLIPTYGLYLAIVMDISTLALSNTLLENKVNEFIITKVLHKKSYLRIKLLDPKILKNAYSIVGCIHLDQLTVGSVTEIYQTKLSDLTRRKKESSDDLSYLYSLKIKNLEEAYRTIMKNLGEQPK